MNAWHDVELGHNFPKVLTAVIEIPRGSNIKYKLEAKSGLIEVSDFFPNLAKFPANYGFFPKTIAADGDALDVFVLSHHALSPLTLLEVKPLGCLVTQSAKKGQENKVIAVSTKDPFFQNYQSLSDLPPIYLSELKDFYETYRSFKEEKKKIKQIISAKKTWDIIKSAAADYEKFIQRY